jgi:hypothetical protein
VVDADLGLAAQERIRHLEEVVDALREDNARLREQLTTTEAREWQRFPLGRV